VHPEDWDAVQEVLADYLAGGRPVYEAEYRMRHRDGQWLWVASRGRVVEWTPQGPARLISGTYMDISARHRSDVALNRQHRLLQALSRPRAPSSPTPSPRPPSRACWAFCSKSPARAASLYEVFQPPGQAPGGLAHASVGVLPAALSAWLAEVLRDGAALQQARSVTAEHAERRWQLIPIASGGRIVACVGLVFEASVAAPSWSSSIRCSIPPANWCWPGARARAAPGAGQLRDATEQLANKTRALELTLDSISQGIASFDDDGVIRFYNRRCLELLELPEHVLQPPFTAQDVVRFQAERGDFGPSSSSSPPRRGWNCRPTSTAAAPSCPSATCAAPAAAACSRSARAASPAAAGCAPSATSPLCRCAGGAAPERGALAPPELSCPPTGTGSRTPSSASCASTAVMKTAAAA
jgi:PAS domain-containing protein